jgi:hypothetical protein
MKRFVVLALAFVFALGSVALMGCGEKKDAGKGGTGGTGGTTEKKEEGK